MLTPHPKELGLAENAAKLAAFLRRNPKALIQNASQIAGESGVDEFFISEQLSKLGKFISENQSILKGYNETRESQFSRTVKSVLDKLTQNLAWTIGLSQFTAVSIGLGIDYANGSMAAGSEYSLGVIATAIYFFGIVFQWLLILYKAALNQVFKLTLINILVNSILFTPFSLAYRKPEESITDILSSTIFIMLLNAMLFGIMAAFFALAGRLFKSRREQRKLHQLSRQELLDRLFDLESRISVYPRKDQGADSKNGLYIVKLISKYPVAAAVFTGLFLTSVSALLNTNVSTSFDPNLNQVTWFAYVNLAIGAVQIIFLAVLGAVSKGLWRSVYHTALFGLSTLPAILIPTSSLRTQILSNPSGSTRLLTLLLFYPLVYGIGGYLIQLWIQSNLKDSLLKQNDPQSLLAEILQIQYLLTPQARDISIMVVDVVVSSKMKLNSDPFVSEWSFRAFQNLIDTTCKIHKGQLFSVAGDGAIFLFDSPELALASANSIQLALNEFNQTVSKMPDPFRCRIGIHSGEVVGDLEKIQYSQVIDIAAHIEAACEVSKIALSETSCQQLSNPNLGTFLKEVDGQNVYSFEVIQ